jgi:NADH:ubiquinone oxidoreductase subunit 3 (subunit A)
MKIDNILNILFFFLFLVIGDTAIIMMFLSIILNAMLNNNNNKMYTAIEKANERGGFSIKNMFYVVFLLNIKGIKRFMVCKKFSISLLSLFLQE